MIYGYIYKLFCLDTREMYIGSTINLKKRIQNHKEMRNTNSKQIINRNNYIFLILKEYWFVNTEHLWAIESSYIDNLPCVNKKLALSNRNDTQKKYNQKYKNNNKEKTALYNQNYRKNNINYYKEYSKKFNLLKKECNYCKKYYSASYISKHIKICKSIPSSSV